jgi:hypothetical protein
LIYAPETVRWKGPSASELNNPVEDLLFSRWGSNRKVRFFLDLPDFSNNSCTPIEQGHDLLVGGVYLLSARRESSCGV